MTRLLRVIVAENLYCKFNISMSHVCDTTIPHQFRMLSPRNILKHLTQQIYLYNQSETQWFLIEGGRCNPINISNLKVLYIKFSFLY